MPQASVLAGRGGLVDRSTCSHRSVATRYGTAVSWVSFVETRGIEPLTSTLQRRIKRFSMQVEFASTASELALFCPACTTQSHPVLMCLCTWCVPGAYDCRMASVLEKRLKDGSRAYLVRYRTADGAERSKQFKRKRDADAYVSLVEVDRMTGTLIDPRLGRITRRRVVGSVVADGDEPPRQHPGPRCPTLQEPHPAGVRQHPDRQARPDDGPEVVGRGSAHPLGQPRAGDDPQGRAGVEQDDERCARGPPDRQQPCRQASTAEDRASGDAVHHLRRDLAPRRRDRRPLPSVRARRRIRWTPSRRAPGLAVGLRRLRPPTNPGVRNTRRHRSTHRLRATQDQSQLPFDPRAVVRLRCTRRDRTGPHRQDETSSSHHPKANPSDLRCSGAASGHQPCDAPDSPRCASTTSATPPSPSGSPRAPTPSKSLPSPATRRSQWSSTATATSTRPNTTTSSNGWNDAENPPAADRWAWSSPAFESSPPGTST